MTAHVSFVGREIHHVVAASSWHELIGLVHAEPVDVAIVDVGADAEASGGESMEVLSRVAAGSEAVRAIRALQQAAVPILVYTTVTSDTARHLVDLVDCGIQNYVFRGIDDQPGRFRDRLEALGRNGLEDRVLLPTLDALAQRGAPSLVIAVVRQLFRAPERFRVASDLAAVAGCTRYHFNETLRRAGLAPGRTVVLAARLLRAYHYGHRTGAPATVIAARLRYENAEKFRRHVYQFTGGSFAAWCQLTPEQCVGQIQTKLSGALAREPDSPSGGRTTTASPLRLVG